MKAPFDFVIEPKGNRYNNAKKVGDKDLIINEVVYNSFVWVTLGCFGISSFEKIKK